LCLANYGGDKKAVTKKAVTLGFPSDASELSSKSEVKRFERSKDKGRCFFDAVDLPPVPVSRSKLKETRDALDAFGSAVGAA